MPRPLWRARLPWAPVALLAALAAAVPAQADRREDLERLRRAIEDSRARVARYEREERGLLETLETLERTAALLEQAVAVARERSEAADRELAGVNADAQALSERLDRIEASMSRRAVALYRAGELGSVRLLFASEGLREFFTRVYALRRLLGHDADLLDRHREASRRLDATRLRVASAAREAASAQQALRDRSQELDAERAAKRRVVDRLRASRASERSALAELETAARALEETLSQLQEDAGAEAVHSGQFASLRGSLPPPVPAEIARGYGRVVDRRFRTETFRKGAEFDAPVGTPVRAVADGRVRYAGRFRGYGNLLILDHGDAYFTVSAHLSRIEVAVGAPVRQGEVVGRVGETGSLSGPRLYFEVRRGAKALDPRDWLRSLGRAGLTR